MSEKRLIQAENVRLSYGEQEVLNFDLFQLYEGDKVIIKRSELKLKLIRIKPRTFYDTLSKKLIKRG